MSSGECSWTPIPKRKGKPMITTTAVSSYKKKFFQPVYWAHID